MLMHDLKDGSVFNAMKLTDSNIVRDKITDLWVLESPWRINAAYASQDLNKLFDAEDQLGLYVVSTGGTVNNFFAIRICDTGDLRFVVVKRNPNQRDASHLIVKRAT